MSLLHALRKASLERPGDPAFLFLANGEDETDTWSFGELDRRARAIGALLQPLGTGSRVLLLFPPGLDFISGFLGCLYAGCVAVPAYPPQSGRGLPRLQRIVQDAQPGAILTSSAFRHRLRSAALDMPALGAIPCWAVDEADPALAADWREPDLAAEDLVLLQYTSGSTSLPKGVMVSHGNLLHNEEMVRQAFSQSAASVVVSWLPPYHDMGLIGGLLQPLYVGARCILMSPMAFLQKPLRWLRAVSRYRGTTSGGPNFAYDLCVRRIGEAERADLDLSSWTLAFNGAEPVRADTLERFAGAFSACGFRKASFYPCYGLAEATLFVAGGTAGSLPRETAVDAAELALNRAVELPPGHPGARSLVSCGHPWNGQRIAVVDPESELECPPGRVGEIWVEGPSVARGYWNRSGPAAPPTDGSRGLRTGDLGFLSGGELFVTGRLKDLIIVRGRNHYPQDLELTAEHSHPALRPGGGAAFSIEVEGDERVVLVHEVARRAAGAPGEAADAVRRAVAEEHELQVHEVVLIAAGTLPKTSSGKNQRGVCRNLYLQGRLEVVERAGGPGEAALAPGAVADGGLAELLPALRDEVSRHTGAAAERIGLAEPLTRLGLDSLAAVELQASLERRWGVTVPLASLLAGADLLEVGRALLAGGEGEAGADRVEPGGSGAGDSSPLSYGQQALWVLHRLAAHSGAYHIAAAARAVPALDGEALRRALGALARRHAALRATFHEVEGVPVQRFDGREPELREVEASGWSEEELERRLLAEAQRPFDLGSGPLLRMVLLRRSPAEDRLLLATHHIVADFWSLALLARELSALYAAESGNGEAALPMPAVSYADYVLWEQRRMAGRDGERLWEYWRERLSGPLPELDLPTDRPRPPVQSYVGASVARALGPALSLRVSELARACGATISSLLLAAFEVLLHRYSRQWDLLVGVPTAGRRRPELADLVGYFVNPVVVRVDLSGDPGFAPLLARVHAAALAAVEHGDYPFALLAKRLQPERDPSRSPLFQAMFLLEGARRFDEPALAAFALREGGARLRLGRHILESVSWPERTSQLDLTLRMGEVGGSLIGSLQYNSDLLDAATAERMLGHLEVLLAAAVLDPERSIAELPLLTRGERDQMLRQWSGTRFSRPAGACLHELFAAQAARSPGAPAIVDGERRWTYDDLNRRANRIAHRLRRLGLGPERLAGVLMGRSAETVAALLGVLKAGAAYLFLDPGHPAGRLSLMAADAGLAALLTEERFAGGLPLAGVPEVRVDAGGEAAAGEPDGDPEPSATPDNLAYVIYTSGSTGRPKGVAVTHRGPVERMRWAREAFPPELLAGVLGATSFGFDVSVFELFAPLSWGGTVILADSVLELAGLPAAGEVTLVSTVPSAMAELAAALPPAVRAVVLAGEALTAPVVERVYGRPGVERVDNLYGPTEDSIYSTFAPIGRGTGRVTIGRPLANTRVYVVDRRGGPVPAGVPGELCLAGAGTARGYLGRPDLTAERFVPDPFASEVGGRLYRTGDLARWLPGGEIEFLGRLDDQVKVRGFRIEPGEIEAALLEHPGVKEAAVVLRGTGAGGSALVACVAPAAAGAAELAFHLQDRLPRYMVPSSFHLLPALPRTASGKVDRRALLATAVDTGTEERHVPPRTPAEERVAAIWAEALGLPRVGVTDDFFRLGGHSLLALRVAWRLQDAFGVAVPLQEILQSPTVAQLAARLETLRQAPAAGDREIRSRPDRDAWPLSAGQRQLWFLDHLEPGSSAYVMPVALQLRGPLDGAALAAACNEIRRRHEPLRSVFPSCDGEPTQIVSPPAGGPLPFVDLTGLPRLRAAAEVSRVTRREALRPFDLAVGPLLRIVVFRLAAEDHRVLVALHHVVGDGRSAEIFFRELGALYEALSHGRPSPLPELPIQYCDFAAWQSEQLARGAFDPQLAYWRERLAGSPESLELPLDRARTAVAFRPAGRAGIPLGPELWESLRQLGRRHHATPFMVLLAAFQAQLSRYTGERDLVVGTPVAGRDRRETEDLIGFLVNTLALRTDLSGDPAFLELLARVRAAAVADFVHQELPFARLVEELRPERHPHRTPLFQVMLSIAGPLRAGIPGLTVLPVEIAAAEAKFDLLLAVEPAEGGLSAVLEYDAGLFDAATGHRLLASYESLLRSAVRGPERRLSDLDLLTPVERGQLLARGEGRAGAERPVWAHEAFAGWAARSPERLAMELGDRRWSYGELEEWSNRLASCLV
ncbi:MAG TPA: amino acid adenylation domain-containing protein, partial [Thermoanaerobaculia bacterium]|nr:amino acid adenylation domain-containing protein [Thermoanaerobaculia bacterium]